MKRLLIVAGALALLVAACEVQINVEAQIEADGTGLLVLEFGLDDEARETIAGFGEGDPFDDPSLTDTSDLPEGATTRIEERGGLTFLIAEVPVDDWENLDQLDTSGAGDLLGGGGGAPELDVTITDTLVTVNGSLAQDAAGGGDELVDPALFAQFLSASLRIQMPGKILDHNADSQDGNTLVWNLAITDDIEIFAQSDPSAPAEGGGDGFPMWAIIAIIAAVVVVLGGIMMRGRGSGGTPTAAAAGDAPPPPPPPPPPAE